jgi:hypothetical protein
LPLTYWFRLSVICFQVSGSNTSSCKLSVGFIRCFSVEQQLRLPRLAFSIEALQGYVAIYRIGLTTRQILKLWIKLALASA